MRGAPNAPHEASRTHPIVSEVMQNEFGMGFIEGGKMSLKLTNVVWVDETLTAHSKVRERSREGSRTRVRCDVWVEKEDGTRVLIGDASALE